MSNEHKYTSDDLKNANSKYAKSTMSDAEFAEAKAKASNLGEQMGNFFLLLDLVKDGLSGKFKIDGGTLAMIIGAVIYVISPVDLVPDILPIVGWLDDIAMIGVIMNSCSGIINQYSQQSKKDNIIDSEKE